MFAVGVRLEFILTGTASASALEQGNSISATVVRYCHRDSVWIVCKFSYLINPYYLIGCWLSLSARGLLNGIHVLSATYAGSTITWSPMGGSNQRASIVFYNYCFWSITGNCWEVGTRGEGSGTGGVVAIRNDNGRNLMLDVSPIPSCHNRHNSL